MSLTAAPAAQPGYEAQIAKGWWGAHRWLLLRRLSQAAILALFLAGPWAGVWIVKGNLNYSLTLGVLPLTDPLVLLQSLAAGHAPERNALLGVSLVILLYLLAGGRAYCAWVCPMNAVTDAAGALRRRLGIKGGASVSRSTRYWLLAMALGVAAASGSIAWELVNPVSMLHRGLVFGMGAGWTLVLAVFLFDLFVMNRGWCGHLCPVGAAYSLIGRASLLRVSAAGRSACNDCMDCFAVCPEPQVIRLPLKGKGASPVILSPNCTNCARCIDACSKDVFAFGTRFKHSEVSGSGPATAARE
jgi:ferredoxin-type protein NapH